jgi:Ca-activated chloride channel homolog
MKFHTLTLFFVLSISASAMRAQHRCMTPDEAARVVATVNFQTAENDAKTVRKEVLNMQKDYAKLAVLIYADFAKNQKRVPELNKLGESNLLRVCDMLKQYGWPSKERLKDEGSNALQYLIRNGNAVEIQRELLPVLVAASKKGEVAKPVLADVVDTIRIGSGGLQVFGTQATRRGDVIYILPLQNESKVDEWRKAYDLPPLANEIRKLERRFFLPVLISRRLSGQTAASNKSTNDVSALGISDDDGDIKVETKIVNLNVRVFTREFKAPPGVTLTRDDFTIIEDGVEQEVQFFSAQSAPFDLVLLLDFSGSTMKKQGLIKKAAKRFVEIARPDDRVSVIAFALDIQTMCEFTTDKTALNTAIDKINVADGSVVWDSLKWAYENVLTTKMAGRRSAIVFMTDGADTSSKSTFADAMEVVRHGDTTVFSVYVNPFRGNYWKEGPVGRLDAKLQASLSMLADETGGQLYKADDMKHLNGLYEQVVNDIGRIYSIGYESKNEKRDGGWRSVEVKLKSRPELTTKTRRGYYAN